METKNKVTIEIELKDDQFQCENCKRIHTKSAYCIAQNAMGYDIVFTCDCGHKTELNSEK